MMARPIAAFRIPDMPLASSTPSSQSAQVSSDAAAQALRCDLLHKITELNGRMRMTDCDPWRESASQFHPARNPSIPAFNRESRGEPDPTSAPTEPLPERRGVDLPAVQTELPNSSTLPPLDLRQPWTSGIGFLPEVHYEVERHLQERHGAWPPPDSDSESRQLRDYLIQRWTECQYRGSPDARTEIFVGPTGTGKTTCLGKWLAQTVLVEGRRSSVWRLNGIAANTAESLSILCEGLNVNVNRSWPHGTQPDSEPQARFIDFPGADAKNAVALGELKSSVDRLGTARIHLVLNAAYDIRILMKQAAAFQAFRLSSLILTHLDEESNRLKLWNLIVGAKLPLSYVGAGQNVPGDFMPARVEMFLPPATA